MVIAYFMHTTKTCFFILNYNISIKHISNKIIYIFSFSIVYLGNTTEPSSRAYSFTSLAVNSFKYAKNDCSIVGGNVVFKYSISETQ